MARGFESKDVEYQQAEAERQKTLGPALTPEQREQASRRRTIELALARARAERDATASETHRRMLDEAVLSLQRELLALDTVI